jgi:hypothetical protein
MGQYSQYLPFLIPLVILELGLMFAAYIHLIRHRATRTLNVPVWAIIILIQIVGPVLYFVFGRKED